MTIRFLVLISCLFVSSLVAQTVGSLKADSQPPNGSLRATVVDDSGKSVSGASVRLVHYQSVQNRIVAVTSDPAGSLTLAAIPSGDYVYCVTPPLGSDYIDECAWSLTFMPRVAPAPNQAAPISSSNQPKLITLPYSSETIRVTSPPAQPSTAVLKLRKGARVIVQVNDPGKRLDSNSEIFIMATGPSESLIPSTKKTTASGLTFEQIVPLGARTKLLLIAPGLQISGTSGAVNAAMGMGYGFYVDVPKVVSAPLVQTFVVTGRLGK